jgi:UDPglucose 6-dehydrogenase
MSRHTVPQVTEVPSAVGVVGAGYVGLVTAAALASLGHSVVCLDIDQSRVERLRRADVPIHEPGLSDLLDEQADRLSFTTSPSDVYSSSRLVFVTVDTPPLPSGDADLSRVQAVIDAIPIDIRELTLVMKSTVPVGTGARVQQALARRGLGRVRYVSNPEFLREGCAVADVLAPDRVVVGADDPASAEPVLRLWAPLGGEVVSCDLASAEMMKLTSNAFLATKISFINEIANVCELVGADVATVAHGMGLDRRIGPAFLQAGLGYGGSCFPKDVTALKRLAGNSGYHFQLLSAVIEVNELQKRRVVTRLQAELGGVQGRRITLLGLAFKPGTDDLREATSLVLAGRLVAEGAHVTVHDPVVGDAGQRLPDGVVHAPTLRRALRGADAAILVTEWPQYADLLTPGMSAEMATPVLVDGRNMLDPAAAQEAGYRWIGVGRPEAEPDPAWTRAG